MRTYTNRLALGLALAGLACPTLAAAQPASAQAETEQLLAMEKGQLRGEIQRRYDEALGLTKEGTVVAADNPRFLWAAQAKAQCGIALGFLKSGHKDPVSIGKCVDAYLRMQMLPPPPPPPPAPNEACAQPIAGIVFFEWDSAVPPESAMQTMDAIVQNQAQCNWKSLVVTGHTDRSGSDAYNNGLSVRRANAVASLLEGKGIARSVLAVSGRGESEPKVPTVDGERNPQNRRVEITVE